VRVEVRGDEGFEDRKTFTVVGRDDFPGVGIVSINETDVEYVVKTKFYQVLIEKNAGMTPKDVCAAAMEYTSLKNGVKIEEYPDGIAGLTQDACCAKCQEVSMCTAWEWQPSTGDCFLMQSPGTYNGETMPSEFTMGWGHVNHGVTILSADGKRVLGKWSALDAAPSLLNFPTPASMPDVFALKDSPRFVPPEWGATPMPDNYTGEWKDTNGFDIHNDSPDVYFFLTTGDKDVVERYKDLRKSFLKLTGPVPALPKYVFGTWFSWWHAYTQTEAMEEIGRWESHNISLDVFGLDVDWRDQTREAEYIVNTDLFPDMRGLQTWLHEHKLHTYFNDHPESKLKQMDPQEVKNRYDGLTKMLDIGIDYWWYDSNWHLIIPGVFGLDNRVWVQYVYRCVTEKFNREHRNNALPFTLAMFTSDHPAHHRFPVWWTGDINTAAFDINSHRVVDNGVQLKPYVHPDCSGFIGKDTDEVYTRWIQFCSMSTLIRIHSSVLFLRQPWMYSAETERIVKYFIDMRYSFLPSYVAGGNRVTEDGTPIVERCDLQYPKYKEASSSDQYILLQDMLAAPINPFLHTNGTRDVWIPPGTWQSIWDGSNVAGPQTISVTVPIDKMPLYYRVPSMLLTAAPAQNTATQDWNTLFLEVFPDASSKPEQQLVRKFRLNEDDDDDVTYTFSMEQPNDHTVVMHVSVDRLASSWMTRRHIVRLHGTGSAISRLGQPNFVVIDDTPVSSSTVYDILPTEEPVLPFSSPATAQVVIPPATNAAKLERTIVMKW